MRKYHGESFTDQPWMTYEQIVKRNDNKREYEFLNILIFVFLILILNLKKNCAFKILSQIKNLCFINFK